VNKRTFVTAPLLAAALVVAACGGDDDSDSDATPTSVVTTTESTDSPEASDDGEATEGESATVCEGPGVDDASKTVTVGAWDISTGPTAYSVLTTNAIRANIARVNADGGVNGWQIEYIANDTGGDPVRVRQELQNLIEGDTVLMLLWGPGSSQNGAVAEYIGESKVPYIPGEAADRYLGQMGDGELYENIFPMLPPYSSMGRQLATYAVEELGAETIGLVYQDDDVGLPVYNGFEEFVQSLGAELTVAVSEVASDTDLTSQGQAVAEAAPDAVVFWGSPALFTTAMRATVNAGHEAPWLAAGFVGDENIVGTDPELTSGSYFNPFATPFFLADDPEVSIFLDAMAEYQPDTPATGLAQNGYSSSSIFLEALEVATADGQCPTREGLVEALSSFDETPIAMLPAVTYAGEDHLGVTKVYVTKYENGEFSLVSDPRPLPDPPA
jgi:branched-chain amino acid transport system substrate-binding protein